MQTIVADSSQLTVFDQCPTQWYYRYIKGLVVTPIERTEAPVESVLDGEKEEKEKYNYRLMGTCVHHILEHRYRNAIGSKYPKIFDSIKYGVDITEAACKESGEKFLTDGEVQRIEETTTLYDMVYAVKGDFQVSNPNSCELGFSEEIYKDENFQFILEGRIDIVEATEHNGTAVMSVDHKSQGGNGHNLYERCIQFRNYNLVSGKDFFCVNYIRFHKKLNPSTFNRPKIPFSSLDRRIWKNELINIFRRMSLFLEVAERGLKNFGEQQMWYNVLDGRRRSSCSGMVYKCQYIPLCDAHNVQNLVSIAKANYHFEEPHKPW